MRGISTGQWGTLVSSTITAWSKSCQLLCPPPGGVSVGLVCRSDGGGVSVGVRSRKPIFHYARVWVPLGQIMQTNSRKERSE